MEHTTGRDKKGIPTASSATVLRLLSREHHFRVPGSGPGLALQNSTRITQRRPEAGGCQALGADVAGRHQ